MDLADREIKRCENLTRLWYRHRLQFLLLAEGSIAITDDHHRSVPDSRAPKGAGEEIQELDARWAGCRTNDDRRSVIKDAQTVLRHFLIPRADPGLIRDTVEWRRAIALESHPATVLARKYKVSKRTVYNYRREFKAERDKAAA